MKTRCLVWLLLALPWLAALPARSQGEIALLNVSYDPTRELYQDINAAFLKQWAADKGRPLVIKQSHGGSGKQARSVIDGLEADVVTLALAYDIDAIAEKGKLLPKDWQARLPHHSAPYTSVIVFLVRKGNPRQIRDWNDLARPGVKVITPNPKTSGGARWNYLAAYGYEIKRTGGDAAAARSFLERIFRNVPVLDTGARGATTTFLQRGLGDVMVAWENEALLVMRDLAPGKTDIVYPSMSILAEPTVAWVDEVARKHGTLEIAQTYLKFLYSESGQEIAARHYYRPRSETVLGKFAERFPPVKTFTIEEMFGTWSKAHQAHFAEGAAFDRIYEAMR